MHHQLQRSGDGWRRTIDIGRVLLSLSCVVGVTGLVAGSSSAASLPDGRAYELVTPPDLLGAPALPIQDSVAHPVQPWNAVSADGSKLLWISRTVSPGIDSTGSDDVYLSRRGTSGWTSTYVSPPGSKMVAPPVTAWATANLDRVVWQAYGATIDPTDQDPAGTSSDPHQYSDLYRREADGSLTRLTQGSMAPPVASENTFLNGSSLDALKVVFTDARQLEPDAPVDGGVYQRVGTKTTAVSKDENGVPVPSASGDAVSDDGNMVAFDSVHSTLFLRDVEREQTIHIADSPFGDLSFESMSADGQTVFFTSSAALTSDDIDTGKDLYEYDATSRALTRISAPTGATAGAGPGNTDACTVPLPNLNGCDVAPVAVSRDGSKVYFVSPEQLDGTRGTDGAPNLYLREGSEVHFVATLDPSDPDFGSLQGTVSGSPLSRHVRFTPDGSKLMFESRAQLTGYDNAGHTEVYVHDAMADSVICASCRPSGAPPTGDAGLREAPGSTSFAQITQDPLYPANADQHGDHIFFHSSDAILPRDTNGRYDVYEYTASNGATALISSGLSPNDSLYLGNGVDGKDVFFFTTETLVPQDLNGNVYKIYDAHVGGGFGAPTQRPPCAGDGCRGTVDAAPAAVRPGTALITGRSPGKPVTSSISKLTASGPKSVRGTSARLTVKVSGPGRLRASGSGVARASVETKKASTYHITVKLSHSAVQRLRRTHRLKVSVTVQFTPSAGITRSARVRMTFSTASKKKGR